MLKYTDTQVVFLEVPDEITLAINISNCCNHCVGCHSPYLKEDVGEELTHDVLRNLIESQRGITCVCFMGEGNDKDALLSLALFIQREWPTLMVALYSGREEVEDEYNQYFNYIKVGPYKAEFGPLNKETTNQRLYKIMADGTRLDITERFWKKR